MLTVLVRESQIVLEKTTKEKMVTTLLTKEIKVFSFSSRNTSSLLCNQHHTREENVIFLQITLVNIFTVTSQKLMNRGLRYELRKPYSSSG